MTVVYTYNLLLLVTILCTFSSAAPKSSKIDTNEFDEKIQQLKTMGISEVCVILYTMLCHSYVPYSRKNFVGSSFCGWQSPALFQAYTVVLFCGFNFC